MIDIEEGFGEIFDDGEFFVADDATFFAGMDFHYSFAISIDREDRNTGLIGLLAGADARTFDFDGGIFDRSHGADFFHTDEDFIAFVDDNGTIGKSFDIETQSSVKLDEIEKSVGGGVFKIVGAGEVVFVGVVEAKMRNGFVETGGGEVEGGFHDLGIVDLSFLELAIDSSLMLVAQHEDTAVFVDG